MTWRLGCDIGGTFTDFVLLDEETGAFTVEKVLTTPADPSAAVDEGIARLLARHPGFVATTEHVIHGTTLVINAVIERKGARTALVATRGFSDVLEMRREIRYDIYDIGAVYPTPLIERDLRRELTERMLSDGTVLTPLDEAEAVGVLAGLAADGVESVAVCFLHAYANPGHERRVEQFLAGAQPGLSVSLSSEVLPEIKEFERMATTAVNAYVKPLVARYLARLEERLRARGMGRRLFLMLSGGGITGTATAAKFPVRLIESGPVGGALASIHLGRRAALGDVLSFDMGGTTAKAALIRGGELPMTTELEVDRVHRFKRGSGTPLGVAAVDLIEIGAGGGSIAAINSLGLLQVGPQSSGADPGPISYGHGGTAPTVTDADLVLGYLDPAYFLGGAMRLDVAGARAGIESEVGKRLGLGVDEAAWGIHEVVNENMASAIRMYVAEKGGDLAATTLVAFGGAGPVHADGVAKKLGVPRLVVPRGAGVFSALGFLVAPVSFEVSRTRPVRLPHASPERLAAAFAELEAEAARVVREAAAGAPLRFARAADICYHGQGHSIRVALASGDAGLTQDAIAERFLAEYRARYGYSYDDLEPELVTLRVTATADRTTPDPSPPVTSKDRPMGGRAMDGPDGRVDPETPGHRPLMRGEVMPAQKGERPAWSSRARRFVPHRVYAMDRLTPGTTLTGPAILEEDASTLIVGDGASAVVDARGFVMVTL
jgi:N-methylhydantoinase A